MRVHIYILFFLTSKNVCMDWLAAASKPMQYLLSENALFVYSSIGIFNAIKNYVVYKEDQKYHETFFSLPYVMKQEYQYWSAIRVFNHLLESRHSPNVCSKAIIEFGVEQKIIEKYRWNDRDREGSLFKRILLNLGKEGINSVKKMRDFLFEDIPVRPEPPRVAKYASYWNNQDLDILEIEDDIFPEDLEKCYLREILLRSVNQKNILFEKNKLSHLIFVLIMLGNIMQAIGAMSMLYLGAYYLNQENIF